MSASESARRSFIHRRLTTAEAAGGSHPPGQSRVKLIDLSLVPRWGVKGRDAFGWLSAQGAILPQRDNQAVPQSDRSILARLSPGEALVLASLAGACSIGGRIESLPPAGRGACYPVPRRDTHCWFMVAGSDAPRLFAKLCGVDLAADQFPNGTVAQTSAARLSAIVIRNDVADTVAFSILAESASAEYLWDCLIDAMAELSGTVLPIEALRAQMSS